MSFVLILLSLLELESVSCSFLSAPQVVIELILLALEFLFIISELLHCMRHMVT